MSEQTTTQRIEAAMEKYAPTGYDPASDDCTIPFAMELVEKDNEIGKLRTALQWAVALISDARSNYIAGSQYDIEWDRQKASVISDATALLSPHQQQPD